MILTKVSNSFILAFVKMKQNTKNVLTSECHSTRIVLVQKSTEENTSEHSSNPKAVKIESQCNKQILNIIPVEQQKNRFHQAITTTNKCALE